MNRSWIKCINSISLTLSSINLSIIILAAALVLLFSACGGGTTGTGGTGSEFRGIIQTTEGDPVADALVTLEETADSVRSDKDGVFYLESTIDTNSVTLLVESGQTETSALIDQLPGGQVEVDVSLELDTTRSELTVTKKTVKQKITPTPTSAPIFSPIPDSTPTGEIPTPTPTDTPASAEPTATSTPTIAATATVTPTITPKPFRPLITGEVSVNDPALLENLKVGFIGIEGRKVVTPDESMTFGTFRFRMEIDETHNVFVVVWNGKASNRITLEGITNTVSQIIVKVHIEQRPNLSIRATLDSLEIFEQ